MGATESLEARVARLEDLEELRALCIAYSRYSDERDFDSQSGMFTEDGVFVSPAGEFAGPAAILGMLQAATPNPDGSSHVVTNVIVDLDGDVARARVTWTFLVAGEGGSPTPRSHGYYLHTFTRVGDAWKILRRESTRRLPPE